jgi:fused signal recognition particle receptor
MFNFFKKNIDVKKPDKAKAKSASNLFSGLKRTRDVLVQGIFNVFSGNAKIDQKLLSDLEAKLLTADVGYAVSHQLVDRLKESLSHEKTITNEIILTQIKGELESILKPCDQPLAINENNRPFVILLVGVNGSGKTTTIGKLAKKLHDQGLKVMLAAGDTFRAAAIEQLQIWGDRNHIPVIAQKQGADSAAVIYDAFQAATARNIDVLIADTAGRLHTHQGFMAELKKVKKTLQKIDPTAPHEVLLVIDATMGQNAINQVKEFKEIVGVSGICLTKLDGTAKGGTIFAIAKETMIPIRFIGVGENIEDLKPFDAKDFVEALFEE